MVYKIFQGMNKKVPVFTGVMITCKPEESEEPGVGNMTGINKGIQANIVQK